MDGALQLFRTFVDQWKTGAKAEVNYFCEGGNLKVRWCADLGPWRAPAPDMLPKDWEVGGLHRGSPSRVRRRQRRAAERIAAEEAVATEKVTAEVAAEVSAKTVSKNTTVAANEATVEAPAAAEEAAAEVIVAAVDLLAAEEAASEELAADKVKAEELAPENAAEDKASTSCQGVPNSWALEVESETSCPNCGDMMTAAHQCTLTLKPSESSSSCSGSKRKQLHCWKCDKLFPVDHQGWIPDHQCD